MPDAWCLVFGARILHDPFQQLDRSLYRKHLIAANELRVGAIDVANIICYPIFQQEASCLELARFRREVYFKALVSHYVKGLNRIQSEAVICWLNRNRRHQRLSSKDKR